MGSRLVSVMPGETLTSSTHGNPSASTIMSTRVTSRSRRLDQAAMAISRQAAAVSSSSRAGAKYSVAPAVYLAA